MSAARPEPSFHLIPSLAHPRSHDRGGHVVQLYTDDVFLVEVLSRFIGGAIAMGDVAVVVATKAHHEGLAKRLSAQGLDTAKGDQARTLRPPGCRRDAPQIHGERLGRRGTIHR